MAIDTIEAGNPGLARRTNVNGFRVVLLIVFVVAVWGMLRSLDEIRSVALEMGLFRMPAL